MINPEIEEERLRLELRLTQLEAQDRSRKNFLDFVRYVWPEAILGEHHKRMAAAFDRIANGTLKRLIVNMPPRHRLALDTEVPTTAGWKTIAQIQPGDYVFAPDGKPVLVTGKSSVFHEPLFEVTSIDGHKIRCDGEHLWTVRFGANKFQTYSTKHLWEREQGQHLAMTRDARPVFRGLRSLTSENRPAILPVNEAVVYPEQELPVDPYVLGVWLGNGHKDCGIVTICASDIGLVRGEFEDRGYRTTDQATPLTFGVLGLKVKLRGLGVLGEKHIPGPYLIGSYQQRLDLLRGLMDTDGNVSKAGQCFFSQSDLGLINQVRELLNSLGVKNTLQCSEARIGDRSYGLAYKVSFYMKGCCLVPRKAERTFDPLPKNRARSVRFRKLEEFGDVQCLEVANPDGLFLIGRGYLTGHNTKSEFASYLLPAFLLGRDPRLQLIEATHTAELAVKFGRKVRDLMDDERFRELFPDVALKADSKAAGRWDTNKGGTYFAAGVGGALTGRGADLCLGGNTIVKVDDAEMRLSEVQVGQRIKTAFGWQEITNKALTIHKEKVKINDIEASLTHPFLTSEGWVHAGALKVGSRIKTETLWRRMWIGASFLLRPRPVRRGPA